jgi:hypothetical protein
VTDAEVIATTHGYACRYTPTICDGPVFRWSQGRFEVSASRNGVMVHGGGFLLVGPYLDSFRRVLSLAERVHARLASDDRGTDLCKQIIREAA